MRKFSCACVTGVTSARRATAMRSRPSPVVAQQPTKKCCWARQRQPLGLLRKQNAVCAGELLAQRLGRDLRLAECMVRCDTGRSGRAPGADHLERLVAEGFSRNAGDRFCVDLSGALRSYCSCPCVNLCVPTHCDRTSKQSKKRSQNTASQMSSAPTKAAKFTSCAFAGCLSNTAPAGQSMAEASDVLRAKAEWQDEGLM